MTAKEHAEIFRQAARVVAGMDTMTAEMKAAMQAQSGSSYMSRSYGPEEAAANRAYQCAASVLSVIAAEYEKASSEQQD